MINRRLKESERRGRRRREKRGKKEKRRTGRRTGKRRRKGIEAVQDNDNQTNYATQIMN